MIDICIIGGGASGIIAAISARMENPHATIHILEKNDKLGKKLLATGNGRCNLSNTSCTYSWEILGFLNEVGVKSRIEEQGRVYPYSGQAQDVLNAFESYLMTYDVKVNTNYTVERVSLQSNGYINIVSGENVISAKTVLISTGGKAGPQFGCSGDGYKIAKDVGHTTTKIIPALAPVECKGEFSKLKGTRVKADLKLVKKGEVLGEERGELQFTEYGLSGICVFNLSSEIKIAEDKFSDFQIFVDLFPDISFDELKLELINRHKNPNISADNLLVSLIPQKLADYVLALTKYKDDIEHASDDQVHTELITEAQTEPFTEVRTELIKEGQAELVKEVASALKELKFTVRNVKGWHFAQCTSGGIPICEINMDTMESKIARGLYFAGELIDYDGPCGGYNLNNAWETGIKAGKAMAMNV
jgi:predicted flavoprotein YhiN